ncbi:MAG: 1-aminocyclopropane-1-carboxylate deaminase/D-cysteine desulfhydrase [Chitinophagaceae bacterium]
MTSFRPHLPVPLNDLSQFYPSVQEVQVLRLDLLHPVISGNKWFKLRFYLEDAKKRNAAELVTWGGPWSNHIVATAAACASEGIPCTGLIRGEEPLKWSATLQLAADYGMKLRFLPRADYDLEKLPADLDDESIYQVPAGGYGINGALGASGILDQMNSPFTHLLCAVGTGTMLAGLINRCFKQHHITGISALSGHPELEARVSNLLTTTDVNWHILREFSFGGYAKYSPQLIDFMNEFYRKTHIPSDFVYTGKLFYAMEALLAAGHFPDHARLLLIHSGGLQGNQSLEGRLVY